MWNKIYLCKLEDLCVDWNTLFSVFTREQEVSNLLVNKKYHEALKIALNLNQPFRTLTIIKGKWTYFLSIKIISSILKEILNEMDGTDHLKNTLLQFSDDHLSKSYNNVMIRLKCFAFWIDLLFSYVIEWNTNTRHSTEAQIIIKVLLSILTPDKILKLPNGQKCIESLLPYTGKVIFFSCINSIDRFFLFKSDIWHV